MSDAGSSIAAASEPIYSQPFLHNHAGLQVGVSGGGGHGSTRYKLTFFTQLRLLLTLILAEMKIYRQAESLKMPIKRKRRKWFQ